MSEKQLNALFERASTFAEAAMKHRGEVAPIWHMITSKGEELVELTPQIDDRDTAMMIMRTLMELMDVVRYVHFTEAWMLDARNRPIHDDEMARIHREGVRNHPDRIEIVQITGEDCECGQRMAHRKIVRPKNGKPYLGPLEIAPRGQSEGRMVGMLPVRGRMQ
jgi:hypothetical protein